LVASEFYADKSRGAIVSIAEKGKIMRRKNDILWKVVLEEVFDDLLRFLYPDADRVYDMERGFEFLEKELAELHPEPDKESDTRFADKLVKVYHRNGEEEWVLLHVEIQGDTSKRAEFSVRMFRHFYRILDRFRRPVSAVVIYTGRNGQKMPDRFEYAYRSTSLAYKYHAVSILDFADAELEASNNPFAMVVMAAKTALLEKKLPEQELLEKKVALARRLMQKGYSELKVRAVFRFLENYVHFKDPEMNHIFSERIQSKKNNEIMGIVEYDRMVGKEIGLREGRRKGRQEERRAFVKNLLTGTKFSVAKIASLANVKVEFMKEIKNEVIK
jgi:predicted transposase YdaD